MTTLPPLPAAPSPGATAEQLAAFEREMSVYRAAAAAMHAEAQAATAVAMAAMRQVQQSEADMKRMMMLDIVARQPHHLMMTEASACASAKKLVDEIFKAYPLP
jgi:hypothetical protein